jgi:hypothetical protein
VSSSTRSSKTCIFTTCPSIDAPLVARPRLDPCEFSISAMSFGRIYSRILSVALILEVTSASLLARSSSRSCCSRSCPSSNGPLLRRLACYLLNSSFEDTLSCKTRRGKGDGVTVHPGYDSSGASFTAIESRRATSSNRRRATRVNRHTAPYRRVSHPRRARRTI